MEDSDEKKREEMLKVATAVLDGTFDVKEYYGLTDGGVEAIYAVGHELFRNKKYDKAQKVFSLLCFLDNKASRFSFAYGAASFMLKQYPQAETGYRAALLKGDYTPNLFLRLAEALICQDKNKEAEDCLREVIRLSKLDEFKGNDSQHAAGRAVIILCGLENKAKSQSKATSETDQVSL